MEVRILPGQPGSPGFGEFPSFDRKARQMRAFLIGNGLWRPVFKLFGPGISKSLQPNPRKLPFSGDSPWRRWNECSAW
jgi:hypothetical protein